MGLRGIYIDQVKLENSIIRASELFECFSKEIPWEAPILSNKKCAAHCQKLGLWVPKSFDKKSPERARWEQQYASTHAFVRALVKRLSGRERASKENGGDQTAHHAQRPPQLRP